MTHARSRPRFWRGVRVRYRLFVRRLDRETPDWMRWLTPWGTSLATHALLLLLLGIWAVATSGDGWLGRRRADDPPIIGQLRDDLTSTAPSDHMGDPFTTIKTDEPPSLSLHPDPTSEVINVPEVPPMFKLGDRVELEAPGPADLAAGSGRGGASGSGGMGTKKEGLIVPFSGRQGDARAKLVRREGGTVESEKAVERGLDWIARHQRPDGGWSLDTHPMCQGAGCPMRNAMQSDAAATGLALLPLLGAGHTHNQKGRYQQTLTRGLKWLMKHQQRSGEIYTGGEFNAEFYSHAIATMTLCEAYGITRDEGLRGPAQRAVNFIGMTQNKSDGGWRYYAGQPGDTSVFGWQLFAFRSAHLAKLSLPRGAIRLCRTYLNSAATSPDGSSYAYRPGMSTSMTMTAEGLLVRQYLGWNRETPALLKGASAILADLESNPEPNSYYWYYATQMLHNMKGKEWPRWNQRVREALITTQTTGEGCDRGSWDPEQPSWDRWSRSAGRLYLTSLSLLTLEVYYRYLPLYRDRDGAISDENGQLDADAAPVAEDEEPAAKAEGKEKSKEKPKAKVEGKS